MERKGGEREKGKGKREEWRRGREVGKKGVEGEDGGGRMRERDTPGRYG